MNKALLIMLAGAVIFTLGHASSDQQDQQSTYCEMVQIYKDSSGEYGWPDYNGNFEELCK